MILLDSGSGLRLDDGTDIKLLSFSVCLTLARPIVAQLKIYFALTMCESVMSTFLCFIIVC